MLLRRIAIENVRSFLERQELTLEGQISIIIGPNGGGKTNLLDTAVVMLTWKMHRFGRIERKALMLRMIEIASQISGVFAKRPSTNDSPWLLSGL